MDVLILDEWFMFKLSGIELLMWSYVIGGRPSPVHRSASYVSPFQHTTRLVPVADENMSEGESSTFFGGSLLEEEGASLWWESTRHGHGFT